MTYEEYLNSLDSWSEYHHFEKRDIQEGLYVDRMFYKQSTEASKMGMVDRFIYIKKVPDIIDAQWARQFSSGLFEYSRQYKQTFGRFFRSMMIVNPVMVVDTISPELYGFIMDYCLSSSKLWSFRLYFSSAHLTCTSIKRLPFGAHSIIMASEAVRLITSRQKDGSN